MLTYYVAMLQQEEDDAETCLRRHGLRDADIRFLLKNAKVHRSPVVYVPIDDSRALVIAPHPTTGKLCSWRASTDEWTEEAAEEVLEGLRQEDSDKTWALFAFDDGSMDRGRLH